MILAIDQGTTGTTVLLLDRQGRLVSRGYEELTQHFPKPGWVEHDPGEILASTLRVIRQALRRAPRSKIGAIAAIGITNQRETTILWDRRTGRPVANAVVWQCRRSAPLCDRLKRRGHEAVFRRKTGLVLDAYFSGTKIRWLLDHVPGLARRAEAGQIAFGTVDSWLLWHLTGGVHATDYTNASRTLLYDIRAHRWDPSLCRLLGVPASMLPVVRPSSHLYGRTVKIGPLPAGIPIAGIAGDQQASMVGHGCLEPGTAKNTYGTGCFLLLNTGTRGVTSRNGLITTLAVGSSEKPVYALEGSVFIAGAAIQWLRDGLRLVASAQETEGIARRVKDTGGAYVVPAFVGLGAPYWDMAARGAIIGLTRGTTREMLVRATLESLAYQTRDVADAMQRDSGMRLERLQVDGGAAKNNWLMQFQADILGVKVVRPKLIENTGKGAAILAGIGIGWWTPSRLSSLMGEPNRTFTPRMPPSRRRRLYEGWQDAVGRVRSRAS